MDNNSIAHTKWNCTYHIVFIPKYRKKVFYGQMRKDLVEIIRKLCEMKKVELIKGAACVDHVHLYLGIPPKLNISDVVAYIKGKHALGANPEPINLTPKCHIRNEGTIIE